jgi:hypothetical protein
VELVALFVDRVFDFLRRHAKARAVLAQRVRDVCGALVDDAEALGRAGAADAARDVALDRGGERGELEATVLRLPV